MIYRYVQLASIIIIVMRTKRPTWLFSLKKAGQVLKGASGQHGKKHLYTQQPNREK